MNAPRPFGLYFVVVFDEDDDDDGHTMSIRLSIEKLRILNKQNFLS